MRCFLAFDLPESVRAAIAQDHKIHHEKLDRQGLRWVRNEKLHITLAFLGEREVEEIAEKIEAICAKTAPFELKTTPMGCFPDWERPSTLWIGVAENLPETDTEIKKLTGEDEEEEEPEPTPSALAEFQLELAVTLDALDPTGDEPADFVPHITFARMKPASKPLGRHYRGYVKSLVHKDPADYALPAAWTANSLTLFESNPDGTYTPVKEFQLGG